MTRAPAGRITRAWSASAEGGEGVMRLLLLVVFFLGLFDANLRAVLQRTRDHAEGTADDFVALLDAGLDLHVERVADAGLHRDHLDRFAVLHERHALQRLAVRPLALALLAL